MQCLGVMHRHCIGVFFFVELHRPVASHTGTVLTVIRRGGTPPNDSENRKVLTDKLKNRLSHPLLSLTFSSSFFVTASYAGDGSSFVHGWCPREIARNRRKRQTDGLKKSAFIETVPASFGNRQKRRRGRSFPRPLLRVTRLPELTNDRRD